jgi:hypothetical protein
MFCGNCGKETKTKFCRSCGSSNEQLEVGSDSKESVSEKAPAQPIGKLALWFFVAGAVMSLFGLVSLGNASALGTELSKSSTAIELAKDMYNQAEGNFLDWKSKLESCEAGSLAKILGCSHQEKMMNDFGNEMAFHLTKLEEFVGFQEQTVEHQNQGFMVGIIALVLAAVAIAIGVSKRQKRVNNEQIVLTSNT